MTCGSRANLMATASQRLQSAYERRRKAQRAAFEAMTSQGAFRAPFEPISGRPAELGLPEPLRLDDTFAEAA